MKRYVIERGTWVLDRYEWEYLMTCGTLGTAKRFIARAKPRTFRIIETREVWRTDNEIIPTDSPRAT